MKGIVTRASVIISTVLFIGFVVIYGYALAVKPDLLQPSSRIHVANDISVFVSDFWGAQIGICNYDRPYLGSMLGEARTVKSCDGYGLYYRQIRFIAPKKDWWTLMLSLWYPIVATGTAPLLALLKRIRGRKSVSERVN